MKNKWYLITSGIIFIIVGLLHLLRVLLSWDLVIENWVVPPWLSVLTAVIIISLGTIILKEAHKK